MPFMYPEQLRELRAQYPNTQFDGHGRVIGGMPLNQYNAQTANPAAIPASVKTYSQFDPATNSWVRHTNGTAPVQPSAPASTPTPTPASASASAAQGTPVNFQQVLGYTPAGFEGATLNVDGSDGSRANAQPVQVSRPLARGNSTDISAAVAPRGLGSGVTGQYTGNYDYSKTHGNENLVAPLAQSNVNVPVQLKAVPEDSVAFNGMGKTPEGVQFTTSNAETYIPSRTETSANTNGWVALANNARKYVNPAIQGINALTNLPAAIGGIAGRTLGQYAVPVATTALGFLNPSFGFSALGNHLVNTRRK